MNDDENRVKLQMNRRNFLKTVGISAAVIPASSLMSRQAEAAATPFPEAPLPPMKKADKTEYSTDVLVIGGGYAGLQAAVSARKKGQKVLLVDKAITGKSGFSPWANTFCFFDETLGDKREAWVEGVQTSTEYMTDLDYFNQYLDDSLGVYKELVEWGVINRDKRDRHLLWPKILAENGVELVQRVMITDLLTEEGAVKGAMGFAMETDQPIVFKAKATILCSGAGSYKAPGYPIHSCTFDGDAMAYRAGARIAGKEWVDFHGTGNTYPADVWTMWSGEFLERVYETDGPRKKTRAGGPGWSAGIADIHAQGYPNPRPGGRPPRPESAPVDQSLWKNIRDHSDATSSIMPEQAMGEGVEGAATGLGIHATEGVFPVDTNCWSGVPGLYAAGDALSSRICGSMYPTIGVSSASAACLGKRAGLAAAMHAAKTSSPKISQGLIAELSAKMMAPLKRESGFGPHWAQEILLNTMAPYYVLKMKDEARLNAALLNIKFLQENIVPKLRATDPHELRLAHETANMILNAEMKIRSSLMRKESRGSHFREDYPFRDDKNWLAWTTLKQGEDGTMVMAKEMVPERMKTNKDLPYAEKYIIAFPGEKEALKKRGIL
jgi:succinate dehydrogenase/fumarate reductase flavoprotein subunit